MKGYAYSAGAEISESGELAEWEALVVDAVGVVIEFWGFKRNQGRTWALLYLRQRALSAAEIRVELGLSKGAVSMILRELESWGVVRRVRRTGSPSWHFVAEIDLMRMIGRVFEDRELSMVRRVRQDLDRAVQMARGAGVEQDAIARVDRMLRLATLVERALSGFLRTARLDITDARGIFGALRGKEKG